MLEPSNIALHKKHIRIRRKRSETDRLINFYESLSGKFPKNDTVKEKLIEIYIIACRYDNAKTLIASSAPKAIFDLFLGDIEMLTGNSAAAFTMWESAAKKYNDNHSILFEVAERFNKHGVAEKAISLYEQSYAKAPKPKELDSVYARAFLFTNLGRKDEAISMWNLIIKSLSDDYSINDGECVDWAKREIETLSI